MRIIIVEEPMAIEELVKLGKEGFGDMVKAVVGNRPKGIVRGGWRILRFK